MKRIVLLVLVFVLGVCPLFSYSPIIEPDPSFLPAILDSTSRYYWKSDIGEWEEDEFYFRVYSYDAEGNLTTEEYKDLKGRHRSVDTYDANGNRTEHISYRWNPNNSLEGWRSVDTYDANGNLTERLSYRLVSGLNDWQISQRYVYTYDANGNQTEYIYSYWDSDLNDWVISWRYVDTYDACGNLTERLHSSWDSGINDWKRGTRHIYTFDANGNLTERLFYNWDSESNGWINDSKFVAYWSELTTQIHTSSEYPKFTIYPNPVKDQITIETYNPEPHAIEIHTLNGQLLYSDKIEGPTLQIDLSSFQKGLYFITVRSRDFVRTEKILKL